MSIFKLLFCSSPLHLRCPSCKFGLELSQMNHRAGDSPRTESRHPRPLRLCHGRVANPSHSSGCCILAEQQGVPRNLPQGCHPGFSRALGSAVPFSERGGEPPARAAGAPVPSPLCNGIPVADVAWPKPARQARWSSCRLGCKSSSFLLCSQGLLICFNTL